ncbi:DUF3313 domain-containing protein [Shewanella sp. SW36]|uniref:DUF3313 domain-containing protein n=1 Tax=unclassified Shewanella TaxID=196818 RepID=UPI0021DA1E9A|nr:MULTISPECIES: DUF3313 domain-containing protein [unclassified Shewanella]MCU7977337.1 DUF3313 domain-containing protein [Shewanella sp. SW36]MCU7992594.1 DUF3313 domain-containing protein [Shewanella sp. SW1]
MSQGSQQSLLASSSMRCAKVALVVLMVGGLGACATSTPLQSNKATSYDGLVKSNDLAMAIPPKQDDFGRYKWATIEPIEVEDSVTAEVSTETTKEVRDVLQNILATEVSKSFSLSERSANKPALVLRVRITRITEASPALNALTTALIGPLRNGALATEPLRRSWRQLTPTQAGSWHCCFGPTLGGWSKILQVISIALLTRAHWLHASQATQTPFSLL